MGKRKIDYPTWKYKSKKGYATTKLRQWNEMLKALYKFQHGSAWLPPIVRNLVDPVKLDAADKSIERYVKKAMKASLKLKP